MHVIIVWEIVKPLYAAINSRRLLSEITYPCIDLGKKQPRAFHL